MTVGTPVFRHSSRISFPYFTARHPCFLLLSFCRVIISPCPGSPFLVGSYLALSVLVELIFPNNWILSSNLKIRRQDYKSVIMYPVMSHLMDDHVLCDVPFDVWQYTLWYPLWWVAVYSAMCWHHLKLCGSNNTNFVKRAWALSRKRYTSL